MPELICNIPTIDCWIEESYLYDRDPARMKTFLKAAVFSVSSVPGRALGFQVMLENGAVYDRLPVTALCASERPEWPESPLSCHQMWDCPSSNITCLQYDFLSHLQVDVLGLYTVFPGKYLMTFDWWGSQIADSPGPLGHKCAHLIELHGGRFGLYPNNKLCFHSPAWVKKPFTMPGEKQPEYKINTRNYICESRRRQTSENYFYKET